MPVVTKKAVKKAAKKAARRTTHKVISKVVKKPKGAKAERRIDIRANAEKKSLIERAAMLRHTTVSAYLLDAAIRQAQEDLKNTDLLILNEVDREQFFSALAVPPKPNAALRKLMSSTSEA